MRSDNEFQVQGVGVYKVQQKGFVFGQELPTTMVKVSFELRNII
jgi:hypothetical protein